MEYVRAFVIGGAICVIGQLLIDLTKLTPARIMVAYVTSGAKAAVKEKGILGVFTGGITAGAAGIAAAVFFSCLMAAIAKPKEKP